VFSKGGENMHKLQFIWVVSCVALSGCGLEPIETSDLPPGIYSGYLYSLLEDSDGNIIDNEGPTLTTAIINENGIPTIDGDPIIVGTVYTFDAGEGYYMSLTVTSTATDYGTYAINYDVGGSIDIYEINGGGGEIWYTDNQQGLRFDGDMIFFINGQSFRFYYMWLYPSPGYWNY
jgi:hypothetical protein